ncbi:MAG: CBS domain-containing protein [Planctomycetaceae bacterium]
MAVPLRARDIMVTDLVIVPPQMDVFEAIGILLKHRISGAPVVDEDGRYLGVFSEKCSMSALVESAYEQLPTTELFAYMDTEAMTIEEETDLLAIMEIFETTRFRRLPVVRDGKLCGQISRRDVLCAVHSLRMSAPDREQVLRHLAAMVAQDTAPAD